MKNPFCLCALRIILGGSDHAMPSGPDELPTHELVNVNRVVDVVVLTTITLNKGHSAALKDVAKHVRVNNTVNRKEGFFFFLFQEHFTSTHTKIIITVMSANRNQW